MGASSGTLLKRYNFFFQFQDMRSFWLLCVYQRYIVNSYCVIWLAGSLFFSPPMASTPAHRLLKYDVFSFLILSPSKPRSSQRF